MICMCSYAETFDVLGVLQMTIPKDFEVLSTTPRFMTHSTSPQYCVRIYMEIIYKTAWLPMTIDLFGHTDFPRAAALVESTGKAEQYYSTYNTADQPKYLLPSFDSDPKVNKNGLRYSRFASDWASGVSANYVGYYARTQNKVFPELIVGVLNSWGAFPPVETIDFNEQHFDEKIARQNENTRSYYAQLQEMIDSIAAPPTAGLKKLDVKSQTRSYKQEEGVYVPSITNLRLRESPSLSGRVVGTVAQTPQRIIGLGPEETIDGLKGRWVRIAPLIGNQAGWAFDGYLRKATEKELDDFYESI